MTNPASWAIRHHIGCLFSVCHLMPKMHISCHPFLWYHLQSMVYAEAIRIDNRQAIGLPRCRFLQTHLGRRTLKRFQKLVAPGVTRL